MPVSYHSAGFTRASDLIKQGKVNKGTSWSAPSDPKPDDCLGVHADATAGTKGRQAYPIIKGETVYRAGVIAAKKRAAQQGETEIASAADKLIAAIDKKNGAGASAIVEGAKTAALRGNSGATFSDSTVRVDYDNGIIYNVALITVGPAKGHGFELDQRSVDVIQQLAAAQPDGVKSRFRHPPINQSTDAQGNVRQTVGDDTGSMIGRIKNVRVEGAQARGDVFIGDYAENVPGQGNLRKYLLDFASNDPAGIGMSAFFDYEPEVEQDAQGNPVRIVARPSELYAIDFVGEPAANPNGLLSAKTEANDAKAHDSAVGLGSAVGLQRDPRLKYLAILTEHGPLNLGGLAARSRFCGRFEALRADLAWLANQGYVVESAQGICALTPKGITAMAAIGVWKKKE